MPSRTLAFFGATGDTAGFCLAAALNHNYDCVALARTPEKLSGSMTAKGVSQELQSQHLTTIKGDVRDSEAVKQALILNGKVVDIIINGIGGTSFNLTYNPLRPFLLADPTICQSALHTILAALSSLTSPKKPSLITISTTGIPPPGKPRDIPVPFLPLYHWLLHSPHADKAAMEADLRAELAKPEAGRVICSNVNVRPSLLVGASKGWRSLRVGTDEEPVRGYFAERRDVGEFVFERMVEGEVPEAWVNGGVHVTH